MTQIFNKEKEYYEAKVDGTKMLVLTSFFILRWYLRLILLMFQVR